MNDIAVKMALQDAAREIQRRFPDRAFALFVLPAVKGQSAQYVSNAARDEVMRAMGALRAQGLPGIPGDPSAS